MPSPSPRHPPSTRLGGCHCSKWLVEEEPHSVCPSVTGPFTSHTSSRAHPRRSQCQPLPPLQGWWLPRQWTGHILSVPPSADGHWGCPRCWLVDTGCRRGQCVSETDPGFSSWGTCLAPDVPGRTGILSSVRPQRLVRGGGTALLSHQQLRTFLIFTPTCSCPFL